MVVKEYTGHIYYRSPYESDDNCGTCNGAKCDYCKTRFRSTINDISYDTVEKAEKFENAFKLLINDKDDYAIKFIIKDNKLYCVRYITPSDIPSLCNEESPLYQEYFDKTILSQNRYKECKCTNKDECSQYGCDDSSCYYEMKNRERIEKKWYM